MSTKRYQGSCHCQAVRYEVDLDLAQGTHRCNCSLCWKARAWFAIVGVQDLTLLAGSNAMGEYRWIPKGKTASSLTYRFCQNCGVRLYASGEEDTLGGKFFALHIPTLDDAGIDELAAAPLKFNDMLHDQPKRTPNDVRRL